jgi:predicted Zn-dependent peptidase
MLLSDQQAIVCELQNGLTVITVPMPSVHRITLLAHVVVGSRFENPQNNGISHFLEHVLYRGTARHPSAHEQALAFERLGGTLAAATYVDHGTLGIAVPPGNFDETLRLFGETYREPLLAGIEVEKQIVHEEILESLDDNGRQIDADNLIRALCFAEHGLGLPITGTPEQLSTFNQARLRAHHTAYYVARNTIITVAGPIDGERALRAVEREFSALPSGNRPPVRPPAAQTEPRFSYVHHTGSSQTALRVAFRAPSERDPDEPATEMLLSVIDDGMSTRLYHRICDERGLCYDVGAGYEAYADAGLFELAAETAHDRSEAVLDEMLRVVSDLAEHGPTDQELDKARTRYGWHLEAMLDHPEDTAEFLALQHLTGASLSPSARLAELQAVTAEQVRQAAARLFRREGLSVVAVGLLPRRIRNALERRVLP